LRKILRAFRSIAAGARVEFITSNVLLLAVIVLGAFFTSRTDAFLTRGNFLNLLENQAALGVVVVPLALLVIAGHVDLSIGSIAAFAAMVAALAVTEWHLPTGIAFAVGLVAGGGAGAVNGTLCALLGFSPIIVTLGMLGVLRGATLLIKQEQVFGLGGFFTTVGAKSTLGVPNDLWFALAVFVVGVLFVVLTPWGRHIYAIGVNREAAYLSALPVRALPFLLYVVTGTGAGLAGLILAARLNGVSPGDTGLGLELQALTVVLLGGVAFAGGRGRLAGVLFAWIFLAVLQDGLILMNVTPYVQLVASGTALVFAAALDALGAFLSQQVEHRRRVGLQLQPATGADGRSVAETDNI
jgi:ribose/xylose/arabinose/galactoside ABC-type transport system permease subunit